MEIKRQQVEALILQGQKRGLTGKDVIDALVRKGHTPEGVNAQAIKSTFVQPKITPVVEPKTNALERVSTSLKQKGGEVADIVNDPNKSAVEKGIGATAKAFSGISSTAYNVLPEAARNALDKVGGGIGKGFQYLTDKISDSKFLQEAMSGDPENTKNLESALQIASDLGLISGEILGVDQASKALTKGTVLAKKGINAIEGAVVSGTERVITGAENLLPKSPEIMNRVARLKPTDATKFEKLAGKSHGQYLSETGNFGTPDKIIAKEAQKFTQSLNNVDDALAKLPGVYKDGSIADALTELTKKAVAESGDNIKAPYASRVQALATKFAKEGLDMSEINEVKRLFEKNVKLGYNKLTNAEKVAQSTNIDSALRKWQVGQAQKLGFKNIADLNKQTQLSKFIIDKLGDQVVGQTGLNGFTLTDWVMLSGGDPTAVAGFLTKKFFSSKSVQSKIAEILNKGDIKGQITADVSTTPESIKRAVSPQGFEQLNAPKAGAPKSQNLVPRQMMGEGIIEAPAKQIRRQPILNEQKLLPARGETSAKIEAGTIPLSEAGTILKAFEKKFGVDEVKNAIKNRTTAKTMSQALSEKKARGLIPSKQATQPQSKRLLEKPSSNNTTKSPKVNKSIPKVKGGTPETNLITEARKYNSAEQFVKAQGTPKTVRVWSKSKFSNDGAYVDIPVTRKVDNITLYQGGSTEGRQFWTPNKKYAESFGKVTEKTGTFYKVDNGNRVTDVYVEAPTKSQLTDIWKKAVGKKK